MDFHDFFGEGYYVVYDDEGKIFKMFDNFYDAENLYDELIVCCKKDKKIYLVRVINKTLGIAHGLK